MAARSKEVVTKSLADIGISPDDAGGAVATTRVLEATKPAARAATRVVREPASEAAKQLVAFLAERRIV